MTIIEDEDDNDNGLDSNFDLVEAVFNRNDYKPIRIRIDSNFLMEQKKNEFNVYYILPAVIQYWTKTLEVYPSSYKIVIWQHQMMQ